MPESPGVALSWSLVRIATSTKCALLVVKYLLNHQSISVLTLNVSGLNALIYRASTQDCQNRFFKIQLYSIQEIYLKCKNIGNLKVKGPKNIHNHGTTGQKKANQCSYINIRGKIDFQMKSITSEKKEIHYDNGFIYPEEIILNL